MTDIAIVGIDGRFPGAADPDEFWTMLMAAEHGISAAPADRLPLDRGRFADAEGVFSAGFVTDVDRFDHEFFGISPNEAAAMDPQQRLMSQVAWRALEDAGLDPRGQAGTNTAVVVGVMGNEWAQLHMTDYERITPHLGTGNGYCMIANRISYQLDLRGPSWAVDTACSSSLVAVHQACVALRGGECDQALVGGVNVIMTPALGLFYRRAGLLAADAACKPFSHEADGIVRGEAAAMVVLRRLEDAVADGLPVYAVIKGGAINSDGRSNGLTSPNRWSQQAVIAEAYQRSGVDAADVVAVEAHGTGTVLGDMIEANALGAVHGVPRDQPCAIGSVKSNIGHTEGAAGVSAVIKMALALHHGVVPASRHARSENPKLALSSKGLRLLRSPLRLRGRSAVVGVSSFGLGGTNAHLVLAQPQLAVARPERAAPGVMTVSADSEAGLRRNAAAMAERIAEAPERRIGQLCWSSNQVKASGRHRLAVVVSDKRKAAGELREAARPGRTGKISVGWLFTGQGAQYPGMTRALYDRFPGYRRALSEVDEVLAPMLGTSVRDRVLGDHGGIDQTGIAQPALFAVGYAMVRLLDELGVPVDWVAGHSIGEYAAAVRADVMDLHDAARLITTRARLMQELPAGGGMLAVRCPADLVAPVLADLDAEIAVINGPAELVCAGTEQALELVGKWAGSEGVQARRLAVSHAFHSALMNGILDRFAEQAATVDYRPARLPVFSTQYGRLLGDDEVMDERYWTGHIRHPVLFGEAITHALRREPTHLVEIGPRRTLSSIVRRLGASVPTLSLCPGPDADGLEPLKVAARLYGDGLDPDWDALYAEDQRVLRRLPGYRFATTARFWTSATEGARRAEPTTERSVEAPAASAATSDSEAMVSEVLAIVAAIGGYAPEEVRQDTRLHDELGYDSIMLMQLKDRLEDYLGHPVEVEELLPDLTTPGDLIRFLRNHETTEVTP